ncbi:MAG TPA: hypothetical protein VIW02_05690 [Gammaproteobacteria bacterium]
MKNRIGRMLVGFALSAAMAIPAPLALAGSVGGPQAYGDGAAQVIQVDHRRDRYRSDGDRDYRYRYDGRRHDRYRYDDRRYDRNSRRDDRRYYGDRYGDRRHHHHRRHKHKKRHKHDAAPFIFGGIAIGTLLLLNAIENDRRRRDY